MIAGGRGVAFKGVMLGCLGGVHGRAASWSLPPTNEADIRPSELLAAVAVLINVGNSASLLLLVLVIGGLSPSVNRDDTGVFWAL